MKIKITEETAKNLLKIYDRYYFNLFKEIRTSEEEEYEIRNAIDEIAREISNAKKK